MSSMFIPSLPVTFPLLEHVRADPKQSREVNQSFLFSIF
jgi:hypothetical protein